ncbi:MAG: DMT family transporter [Actinomycetota bacterium]
MTRPLKSRIWESDDGPAQSRRLTPLALYALLGVVVLILGLNWPIMSTGVRFISPMWMGIFRLAGATVVVAGIAAVTGRLRLPPRQDLPIIASLAIFRLGVITLLVFTALQMVPPGRSSVLAWTTPLWTVPIASVFLGERMTGRKWIGLALGVTGVVVLFEPWGLDWTDPDVVMGHLFLILAALTNASTAVHIRGHRWGITPLDALPWQMAGATAILLALGLATEGLPVIDWTPSLAGIVAYQGMLASGVGFWGQIVILRNLEPVSATLTMMGVPAVGVASSALFLGEQITPELAAGLVLVVMGVTVNLLSERAPSGPLRWAEPNP